MLYKYNYQGWGENLDTNNIGLLDHSLLTLLKTISTIDPSSSLSVEITDYIDATGEISFALGVSDPDDQLSFYSKEKMVTDGVDLYVEAGDLLGPSGNGSGYAPQIDVWPNISFVNPTPPIANARSASTNENTSVVITLTGSDSEQDSLVFSILSSPSHGSLSSITTINSTSSSVTYTPTSNYDGSDSFTFRAYDGQQYSESATVSVAIANVNIIPTVNSVSASLSEDSSTTITLSGSDGDGQSLNFSVVGNVSN